MLYCWAYAAIVAAVMFTGLAFVVGFCGGARPLKISPRRELVAMVSLRIAISLLFVAIGIVVVDAYTYGCQIEPQIEAAHVEASQKN